ncbi:MAG: hypothetical protein DRQ55_18025 [Planctomycetota bacterium]|nr:MAG: hypothetical protein DRQ55_18025 [Planctomycetota bacterium]
MTERSPDPDSLRYATHWEPVLAAPGRRLLRRIDVMPTTFLDVGAGTGSLTMAAAARWPDARILSLDASAGMLSVAQHRVATERGGDADRFEWLIADALAMPLADGSVDVAVSSFVIQVVADRRALLREVLRVLRPGGTLGLVAWLADELLLAADDAFAGVVAEMGLDEEGGGFRSSRTTDYRALGETADELDAAGFTGVDVQADELRHAWTREEYLVFKEQYDDRDVFESLDESGRARLRKAVRRRWAELPDEAFRVSGPLVSAIAQRPFEG